MSATLTSSPTLIELLEELEFLSKLPHEANQFKEAQTQCTDLLISGITDEEAADAVRFLSQLKIPKIGDLRVTDLIERLECR